MNHHQHVYDFVSLIYGTNNLQIIVFFDVAITIKLNFKLNLANYLDIVYVFSHMYISTEKDTCTTESAYLNVQLDLCRTASPAHHTVASVCLTLNFLFIIFF